MRRKYSDEQKCKFEAGLDLGHCKCDVQISTNLSSLIWNLRIHNVEFQDFSTSQILREISCGHFEAPKLLF